jgi:uncharacterized protein (DUF2147 family)
MARLGLVLSLLLVCGFAAPERPAAASVAPDPSGVWQRGDGNAKVRIAPCGSDVCAINTWIKDTSSGEAVGDRLVMKLTQTTGNVLAGTAYDPKRGRTYSITLTVETTGLTTKGCILYGLLCRSVTWSRLPQS